MMNKLLVLILSLGFIVGCQQEPTKVYQSTPVQIKEGEKKNSDIPISEKTVVVDARPAFDYSVSHLNGSIPLRPEDFTQREEKFKGLLDLDHFALTRRLARLGISPETPVVVVGRGVKGEGEEGRVAWTLKRLGVKDVRFAAIDFFSIPLSTAEAPPKNSVAIWKPIEDESLEVTRDQFMKDILKPKKQGEAPVVIDVRRSDEYLGKVVSHKSVKSVPDIGAINIPWNEFFLSNGLRNESIKSRLEGVGIHSGQKIYVISNRGYRSAAVTLALRDMGYSKTSNFAGGYVELLNSKSK